MAQRLDTVTQHIFAFDDEEIFMIIKALRSSGNAELADEIVAEIYEEDFCEGCE